MSATRRVILQRTVLAATIGAIVLTAALALTPPAASAGFSFDLTGVSTVQSMASGWFNTAQQWAERTYILLFVIELTILGVQGVLFRDNLAEFMASFGLKVFVAGFFMWLISNANVFFPAIVNGFKSAGQQLGSDETGMMTLVTEGLTCAGMMFSASDVGHGIDHALSLIPNMFFGSGATGIGDSSASGHATFSFFVQAIGMTMLFSMAGIVIQYVMITIESFIVMGAGVLFLGFSGTRFTMPFAQGYLSYAVNVGVKLFTFYLILGVANALIPNALAFSGATLALAATPWGLGSAVAVVPAAIAAFELLMIATLLYAVPQFAGSFLSGSSSLSAGSIMSTFSNSMASMTSMRMGMQSMSSARNSAGALDAREAMRDLHAGPGAQPLSAQRQHANDTMAPSTANGPFAQGLPVAAGSDTRTAGNGTTGDGTSVTKADTIAVTPTGGLGTGGVVVSGGTNSSSRDQWQVAGHPSTRSMHALTDSGAPVGASAGPNSPSTADATGPGTGQSSSTMPSSYPMAPFDASGRPNPAAMAYNGGNTSQAHTDGNGDPAKYAIRHDENIRQLQHDGVLASRLANTSWNQLSESQKLELMNDPELRPIAEQRYGEVLNQASSQEEYGRMMQMGALRGFGPPPDAPVSGVQIRLNNPDRL